MTDGNGSYHGLAPSFFEEMTCYRRQKHCRRRPDNPNGPSKFSKYHVYLPHLRLLTSAQSRLLFRLMVGVGIKQNAKCEMLLRKIDAEMNVQNCRFSAKLRNGDGGDMLHDCRQRQLSRASAIVFRRCDMLPTSKTLPATTRQP